MKKTARKRTRIQEPSRSEQRVIQLAAIVRQNLYAIVISEARRARRAHQRQAASPLAAGHGERRALGAR
jgi:hypothetical protein